MAQSIACVVGDAASPVEQPVDGLADFDAGGAHVELSVRDLDRSEQ